MNKNDITQELDEQKIDMMLSYLPEYKKDNAQNIKNKFEQKAKTKCHVLSIKKIAIIGTAASILFATSLAYAGVIDLSYIYQMIFGENVEVIEPYIEPVKSIDKYSSSTESEYNGIVFKLISIIHDENELRIFATIKDTKANRLGEDLEFAQWGLSQGNGGNIQVLDYDQENKKATLMITSLGGTHHGEVTLTINSFISEGIKWKNTPQEDIPIVELLKNNTPNVISQSDVYKRGGRSDRETISSSQFLKYNEMDIPFDGVDRFSLSNVGFVGGNLHLQIEEKMSGNSITDRYGYRIQFINSKKESVYMAESTIEFVTEKKHHYGDDRGINTVPHNQYSEQIFETITDIDQLNDLTLSIEYVIPSEIIEGNWELGFVIPEKITTEFFIDQTISLNNEDIQIDKLSLSPIGISLHLSQNMLGEYAHDDKVFIEYKDGNRVELDESIIHTYEGESILLFKGELLEVERIKSITINNEKVDISK